MGKSLYFTDKSQNYKSQRVNNNQYQKLFHKFVEIEFILEFLLLEK